VLHEDFPLEQVVVADRLIVVLTSSCTEAGTLFRQTSPGAGGARLSPRSPRTGLGGGTVSRLPRGVGRCADAGPGRLTVLSVQTSLRFAASAGTLPPLAETAGDVHPEPGPSTAARSHL
jgi:hypothetical protein